MINYDKVSQFGFNNYFFNYMKWKKIHKERKKRQRCK